MLENNEHHKSFLHFSFYSDLTKIYFFRSLYSFATSLIFVFIPIFLYNKSISLVSILVYSIIAYLSVLIFDPIAVTIIKKIGFKFSLLLSVPFTVLNFVSINYVLGFDFVLVLAGIFQGIHLSLFYTCLDAEIATYGNKTKRGDEIGNLNIIVTLVSTFSSFFGGLILTYYNYTFLLFVFFVIILLSIIPLLSSKDVKLNHFKFSYKDYLRFLKTKDRDSKIFYLNAGADIILVLYLWPIALFLLVGKSFTNLGSILTFASFVSVVFIYFFKKKLNDSHKEKYLKKSAKFITFEYFLKFLTYILSSYLVYFVEVLRKVNRNVFNVTKNSIFYNNAKKQDFLEYILFCDFYGRVGRIFMALFLCLIFLIFGESTKVLFFSLLFGVLISFGLSFLKEFE